MGILSFPSLEYSDEASNHPGEPSPAEFEGAGRREAANISEH